MPFRAAHSLSMMRHHSSSMEAYSALKLAPRRLFLSMVVRCRDIMPRIPNKACSSGGNMAVREFEMYHGIVLTKLVRSDRPLSLKMIETRPTNDWSTYIINDRVNVLIKHSLTSNSRKRQDAIVWQFAFSPEQIRQLRAPGTWTALVCGYKSGGTEDMEICLLDPQQIQDLIDVSSAEQQTLTVKRIEGMSLRVKSARVDKEIKIPRSRLDKWDIP
jgi:hypothetical protein